MKAGLTPSDVAAGLLVPVIGYLLFAVLKFLQKTWRDIRFGLQFPSPPFHWLYGNMHLIEGYLGEKYLAATRDMVEKHPRAHAFWLAPFQPGVVLTHPAPIKQLLKASTIKSKEDYESFRPWLGNSLLMSEGDVWKVHRRLLTPAFHFDVLKQYVSVYNQAAEEMIEKLSNSAKKDESFDMMQQASLCTMEVILQCAFSGRKMSDQTKNEYIHAVKKMVQLVTDAAFNPVYVLFPSLYYWSPGGREFLRLCDFVHKTADSIIQKRREEIESDPEILAEKKRLDFIDILLNARDEDGMGLTDLEIRQEVDTFLFAGHDTTASTLSWTLYALAQHPHHQEKVREEVEQLLAGREDDTIGWEDLHKLPYLTMCMKEAMRLHGPVPAISRTTTEETEIDGIHVPKDTYVGIHMYGLHHNPEIWGPDHMEYDPSRFEPSRMKGMDSHAFMPFSAGQRNCIGQNFAMNEDKVVLARLLHKFTFDVDPSRPAMKELLGVTKAKDGMWMKVKANV